jgi:hypothetical protein
MIRSRQSPTRKRPVQSVSQEAINQEEWSNPENWTGSRWLSRYSCPKDTRVVVPKQITSLGWTLNWAHRGAWVWVLAIVLGAIGAAVAISLLEVAKVNH